MTGTVLSTFTVLTHLVLRRALEVLYLFLPHFIDQRLRVTRLPLNVVSVLRIIFQHWSQ